MNNDQNIVKMELVGYPKFNGSGLGNMIWIWAKCFTWCKDNKFEMIAPTWTHLHPCRFIKHDTDLRLYKGYFSNKGYHKGIAKYYRLLTYGYIQSEISIDTINETTYPFRKNIVFFTQLGEFTPLIGRHKEVLAELLRITNPHCLPGKLNQPFIAIHIRRGDFGKGTTEELREGKANLQIPIEWYISALRALRKSLGSFSKVILFSDGSNEELYPLLLEPNVERSSYKNALKDLLLMSQSAALIASRSSFSLLASYFGQIPTLYFKGARPWHEDIVNNISGNSLEVEWDVGNSFAIPFITKIDTRMKKFQNTTPNLIHL